MKTNSNLQLILIAGFYLLIILANSNGISFWYNACNITIKYLVLLVAIVWCLFIRKETNTALFTAIGFMQVLISFRFDNKIYIGILAITLIVSLIIFGKKVEMKWYKAISTIFLFIFVLLVSGFGFLTSGFGKSNDIWNRKIEGTSKSIILHETNEGALGGATSLILERRIALLLKRRTNIWSGHWGERPDVKTTICNQIIINGKEIQK